LNSVISKDGTRVGYEQVGQGPGIVLVQGAMGTAANYRELARRLSQNFTVFVPDRRGRGMSPREYRPDHSIERDVEDLDCLLSHTGAQFVFGLSSGAVIALEAARTLPRIRKVALYEPPFQQHGMSAEMIARFNLEVSEGRLSAALVTAMTLVRLGPPWLRAVPRCLVQLFIARSFVKEERIQVAQGYAPMSELLPAMRYDFNIVGAMAGPLGAFRQVEAQVLLLGGRKSPAYLKEALNSLQDILPHVRRTEFKGLDHSAPWNCDRGGDPPPIAAALLEFFGAEQAFTGRTG
jgi:pimeloyl-ACP methyl ester carboxylesterase